MDPYNVINHRVFLPKKLPNNISKKILTISLNNLIKNPNKHDKIEFKIIPNCLDFNFKDWNKFYSKNKIKKKELIKFKDCLKGINKNALDIYFKNSINFELYKNSNFPKYGSSQKYKNINICVNTTLMFVHFARYAISVIIMNTALTKKIDKKITHIFFNSINTISKKFQSDIIYTKIMISKNKIVKKYGHLSRGTYDITSQGMMKN